MNVVYFSVFVMVYVVLECYQEFFIWVLEFGNNCIVVGMYFLFDVMGGCVMVIGLVVVILFDLVNNCLKKVVYDEVYSKLLI